MADSANQTKAPADKLCLKCGAKMHLLDAAKEPCASCQTDGQTPRDMPTPAHTPGPWLREGNFVYALNDHDMNVFSASVQNDNRLCSPEVLDANARLIAAAPELLEAAKLFVAQAQPFAAQTSALDGIQKLAAAIAKAQA
jgi:hypothetical protein